MAIERGQSAVIDATLIAPIIVMILLIGFLIGSTNTNIFFTERNEKRFAEDLTYTLLKSTVRYVWYYDKDHNLIVLEDKTVEHLISEDLYLRARGIADIDSVKRGIEMKINRTLRNLTYPIYEYSLHASYGSVKLVIGSGDLPATKMSYTTYIDMPDNNGKAKLTLFVWRVR